MTIVTEEVKKTFQTADIYAISQGQHLINAVYQYESLGTIHVLCAF